MNRNRRGDADIDKELTVTRIDYANGKPMTVLVNWTAHPTFMSGNDMKIENYQIFSSIHFYKKTL